MNKMGEGFCEKCEEKNLKRIGTVAMSSNEYGSTDLVLTQCEVCKRVYVGTYFWENDY